VVIGHPMLFALTVIIVSLLFVVGAYLFYFAVLHPIPFD
jgi:cytochrome c oxidase assembly factor CtaG